MRRSLYVKDDDYRLSFLYGNFTTLTRFTELDVERVLTERLGPLYVSIHTTDPELRATMLRNPRGATSLRWLEVLLDGGIEVHGQVVLCPGINDGDAARAHPGRRARPLRRARLARRRAPRALGLLDRAVAARPHRARRPPTPSTSSRRTRGCSCARSARRCVHAADELYLVAGREPPGVDDYDSLDQAENGIGQWAGFARGFERRRGGLSVRPGFFQSVEGAPALGYRAPHGARRAVDDRARAAAVVVLTGTYAAPLLCGRSSRAAGVEGVDVVAVENRFFGGNIAVAGLLCGGDVAARDRARRAGRPPTSCPTPASPTAASSTAWRSATLDADVRAVATDGSSLRRELEALPAHR